MLVHKFVLNDGLQSIRVTKGARCVAFDNQYEAPTVWILMDTAMRDVLEYELLTLMVAPTGYDFGFEHEDWRYVGTALFFEGSYVRHLFELRG